MRLSTLFVLLLLSSQVLAQSTDTLILSSDRVVYGTLAQNIGKITDTLRFRSTDQKRTQSFAIGTVAELRLANGQRLRVVDDFPDDQPRLSTYLVSGEFSLLRNDEFTVLIDSAGREFVLTKNNFRLRLPELLALNEELAERLENSDFRVTNIESLLIDHYEATGQAYETYSWQRNYTLHFYAGGGVQNNIIKTATSLGAFSFRDGGNSIVKYLEGGLKLLFPPLIQATIGLRYAELTGQTLANRPISQIEPLYFQSDLRVLILPVGLNLTYMRTKFRPVLGGEIGVGTRIGGLVYREFDREIKREYDTSKTFFSFRAKAGIAYQISPKLELSLLYVYDDNRAMKRGENFSNFLAKSRGIGLQISY